MSEDEVLVVRRGRPEKYPYDDWLDGKIHDIHIARWGLTVDAFRDRVYKAARRRGGKVTIQKIPRGFRIQYRDSNA